MTVGFVGPAGSALPHNLVFLVKNGVALPLSGSGQPIVTFDASNYNQPQTISVYSTLSGTHGQILDEIMHSVTTSGSATPVFTNTVDVGAVNLTVAATNAPGVLLLQQQGDASVSPSQSYTYQMLLTQQPAAGDVVTVNMVGDGQTLATGTPVNATVNFGRRQRRRQHDPDRRRRWNASGGTPHQAGQVVFIGGSSASATAGGAYDDRLGQQVDHHLHAGAGADIKAASSAITVATVIANVQFDATNWNDRSRSRCTTIWAMWRRAAATRAPIRTRI